MTKTTSIIAGAVLALSLTACGSSSDDASSGDKATASGGSPTSDASTSTEPSTGTGGSVADETWASRFKKVIPPLADTPDAQLVAAGKKMCTDFEAAPTPATAKAIIKEAETTLKLDSTQANMWTGGAISHFCNDQGTAFLTASVG